MKPPILTDNDPDTDDNNNDGVEEDTSQEPVTSKPHEVGEAPLYLGIDLSRRRSGYLTPELQPPPGLTRNVGTVRQTKPMVSATGLGAKASGVSSTKKAAQQPVPGLNPFLLGNLATQSTGECH